MYITSLYWVITTLTTVGYGDYKGYTPTEYCFQMVVEFLGIGFFSFLMNSINSLFGSEKKLSDIIDKRIENVEAWLRMVEKSRSKNFTKQMYDSIKVYTEQSYKFDFNLINQEEFFGYLKPRIRHRLVQILFSPFTVNFSYMFKDDFFESGAEFKNDFLTNIYSRLYLPRNDIINIGDSFSELFMIQQGCVNLFVKYKDDAIDHDYQFFTLPTFSYFGDYQILYNLKSQIQYKADKCALLICLCIKKDILMELMETYPDARKFYFERAWDRRTEFRRRQKKFNEEMMDKLHNYSQSKLSSLSADSKNDEDVFQEESADDINNIDSETEQMMKQKK